MKWVILILLFAGACLADESGKAACTSQNTGRFWPDAANSDSAVARRTAQTGELEVCSFTGWRYKWKLVSVSISRLHKGKADAGMKPAKAAGQEGSASAAGGKGSQSFR